MAVDKNKIVAEATRLTQKGQYDKALKAYEKILAEDKKEVRTLLKVGELQQKKGDSPAAAATFNQVAEIYGEQGFFLKAVAVYKQIAKLTPADVRVNEKLAGLYQQLGLLNDATTQLQAVATAHEKAGDQGRHLDVLRRLLDLDPENVVTCQRLGDLYAKANRATEALELYRRAAAHLKENKRGDEYVKLAERIYHLTPDDLTLARELAQEYLARGDTKKALGKLQICHGADKQDVDTLRLMAQAFRDLGQVSKTIAVYRALARVYAERGRRDEAASTWRLVQELLPDDPEARDELAASGAALPHPVPARPPPQAPFTPQPGASPPVMPSMAPPVVPARTGTPAPRPAVPHPPEVRGTPTQVARPPSGAPPASASPTSRILTETDVYLKYGLQAKALDHVQKVLETDPENPDALERIRDIRDVLGDRPGAAEAAGRTVKALLERGDEARIAHATQRLRELDPSHAEVSVEPAARGPAPAPVAAAEVLPPPDELPLPDDEPASEAPAVPPPPAAVEGEAPDPHETILVVPPDEEGPRVVAGPEGPAPVLDDEAPGAIESYSGIPLEEERPPVADEPPPPMVLGDDSPLPVDDDARQVEPTSPADEAGPWMDVEVEEIETDSLDEVGPPEPPPLPPSVPAAPEHPWEPLDAELEEVEFYERQGLLEEALLAIRELAGSHPDHPAVRPVLARIEQTAAAESDPSAAPPPMPPPGSTPPYPTATPAAGTPPGTPGRDGYASTGTTGIFDLGAELSAELGPELTPTPSGEFQYSVADVFDQFKRGLEKTVRPDDSATKYDLGIAFQEMGMLDEALEQFRSALAGGNGRREVEILNMIGVCLGLKGRPGEAIEAYRQALGAASITPEAAKAIHFELAAAHEALGEPQQALWYYQRVAQADPAYRGVTERVARLGGGRGVAPGAGPAPDDPAAPPARKARKR